MNPDWMRRYLDLDTGIPEKENVHVGWCRSIVTDYRCTLSVDDAGAPTDPPAFSKAEWKTKTLESLLFCKPTGDAMVTGLVDLWTWLDRLDAVRCPACRGTGEGSYFDERGDIRIVGETFCYECDGRRWVFPVPDPIDSDTVTVCGLPVDRNRLAWWLAGELEDHGTRVAIWRIDSSGIGAIVFDGGGWRLVCASMVRDYHPARYRTYTPGAGNWWTHRKCPHARLVAQDWAMERDMEAFDIFGEHA